MGRFVVWGIVALLGWISVHMVLGTLAVRSMAAKVDALSGTPDGQRKVFLHDTYLKVWPGLSLPFHPRLWAALLVVLGFVFVAVGLLFLLHDPGSNRA